MHVTCANHRVGSLPTSSCIFYVVLSVLSQAPARLHKWQWHFFLFYCRNHMWLQTKRFKPSCLNMYQLCERSSGQHRGASSHDLRPSWEVSSNHSPICHMTSEFKSLEKNMSNMKPYLNQSFWHCLILNFVTSCKGAGKLEVTVDQQMFARY